MQDKDGPDGKDVCLSTVCVEALLAQYPDEPSLSKADKIKRGRLAERIIDQAEVEMTVEETALMQNLVAKAYGTLVVMRADAMLEGPK